MRVSPSRLQVFGTCANSFKYQYILELPGQEYGALTVLGTVFHYAAEVYELYDNDIDLAVKTFRYYWNNSDELGQKIDWYPPRLSHQALEERGVTMLERLHDLAPWKGGELVGTEIRFEVPLGRHELRGVIDKLYYRPQKGELEVIDFKTGARVPKRLRYNLQFTCLAGDTPVLMGDYSWRNIGEVRVGDEVIGFDEETSSSRRRWRKGIVENVRSVRASSYRISFTDGRSVVASEDHRWLSVPVSHSMKGPWFRTDELRPGMRMSAVFDSSMSVDLESDDYRAGYLAGANLGDGSCRLLPEPSQRGGPRSFWTISVAEHDRAIVDRCFEYMQGLPVHVPEVRVVPNNSAWGSQPMALLQTNSTNNVAVLAEMAFPKDSDAWVAGWLAGLYDTDGSLGSSGQVVVHQKDQQVLDRIAKYGARWGFQFTKVGPSAVRLRGNRMERARFFALVAPALARKIEDLSGRTVRIVDPAVIETVEFLGERTLFDITTSTRTFIADGLLTHNCYLYATTRPEFWEQVPGWEDFWPTAMTLKRQGQWFHARDAKIFNVGYRDDGDYRRLLLAVDQMEAAIEADIYPLTIEGEACGWCPWLEDCGTEVESPNYELGDLLQEPDRKRAHAVPS